MRRSARGSGSSRYATSLGQPRGENVPTARLRVRVGFRGQRFAQREVERGLHVRHPLCRNHRAVAMRMPCLASARCNVRCPVHHPGTVGRRRVTGAGRKGQEPDSQAWGGRPPTLERARAELGRRIREHGEVDGPRLQAADSKVRGFALDASPGHRSTVDAGSSTSWSSMGQAISSHPPAWRYVAARPPSRACLMWKVHRPSHEVAPAKVAGRAIQRWSSRRPTLKGTPAGVRGSGRPAWELRGATLASRGVQPIHAFFPGIRGVSGYIGLPIPFIFRQIALLAALYLVRGRREA